MLQVRQVARPEGALLCAVELLPDGALRQDTRRDAAGSAGCSPEGALLCAVELLPDGALRRPLAVAASRCCIAAGCASRCCGSARCSSRWCFALRCGAASRWCFAPSLAVAASRCCIAAGCASRCCWFGTLLVPMVLCAVELLPDVPCAFPAGSCLSMVSPAPAENLHATAPAERQPLPHRLPLRSIPPAALRLRAPSHSQGAWAPTVCAEEFPTPLEASFAILQLRPARLQPHPAQVRQIASQTGVLPRRMRFVAGRGHCSSKSPRARILVLGTSGAHWPARWPRFELTERVAKS